MMFYLISFLSFFFSLLHQSLHDNWTAVLQVLQKKRTHMVCWLFPRLIENPNMENPKKPYLIVRIPTMELNHFP